MQNQAKNIIDFLESKDIASTMIFQNLECSPTQAQILQNMLRDHIEGADYLSISGFLAKFYNLKPLEMLEFLPHFRRLLELGWIVQDGLDIKDSNLLLDLLNERVSLSSNFLQLIEKNEVQDVLEITPYSKDIDYLNDEFRKIELLYKIRKFDITDSENFLNKSLAQMQNIIAQRVKISKNLNILKIIKAHNLSAKEQCIFFAVLKSEYSTKNADKFRDMDVLVSLVSENETQKLENSQLLGENSRLLESGLLDYDEFGFRANKSFFVPNEILYEISNPRKKPHKMSLSNLIKNQDVFELLQPRKDLDKDLDSVILPNSTRELLNRLLAQVDGKVARRLQEWGIKESRNIDAKILFYGPPGTGKTLSAMALAKSLKKQILSFDCSKILSMYVGESEKNVRGIFDTYHDICKNVKNEPILLLDEADQFLSARGAGGHSVDKMHNQMQNIFLDQIEKFEGILVATTNLLESFDSAFSRRFNYKIEFKRPNVAQREQLWEKLLPQNIEFDVRRADLVRELGAFDLSGGQIKLVIKNTAYKVAVRENPTFLLADFKDEIKRELSGNFDGDKKMGFF